MADRTGIEWTDATWNPLRGCSRVSAGCQHCYAETVSVRFSGPGQPYEGLIHPTTRGWNGQIKLIPEALQIPWRWTRGRRIFVNSMSDLFHPSVPFEFIAAVFWVMSVTTRHTYQVLTKRPERMLAFFEWLVRYRESEDIEFLYQLDGFDHECVRSCMGDAIYDAAHKLPEIPTLGWEPCKGGRGGYDNCGPSWPYKNVWLGVSVENQATADERIPLLLQCPAAVRWISAEPLLGPVDLSATPPRAGSYPVNGATIADISGCLPKWQEQPMRAKLRGGLDWVVAGGESGTGARPMHPDWVRSLRDQCAAAEVPFLFKQWGAWEPNKTVAGGDEGADLRADRVRYLQGDGREPDGHFRKGDASVRRVGKKAAGRLLDGQPHDGYPGVANG